jgi:hypothetical protein
MGRFYKSCILVIKQAMHVTVTQICFIPFQVKMLRQIPELCSHLTGLHMNKGPLCYYILYAVINTDWHYVLTQSKVLLKSLAVLRNTRFHV